jgi:alpha-tubulin suppressor-like RCC1 family protein
LIIFWENLVAPDTSCARPASPQLSSSQRLAERIADRICCDNLSKKIDSGSLITIGGPQEHPVAFVSNSAESFSSAVSCGNHFFAIGSKSHQLYEWGSGISPFHRRAWIEPRLVDALRGVRISSIVAGEETVFAITDCGKLVSCGAAVMKNGSDNTARVGHQNPEQFLPVEGLPEACNVINAAIGEDLCGAVLDNGDVYTWGHMAQSNASAFGHCPDASCHYTYSPTYKRYSSKPHTLVGLPREIPARKLALGAAGGAVVTAEGSLWIWGIKNIGNSLSCNLQPLQIVDIGGEHKRISSASVGQAAVVALTADGEVWTWRGDIGLPNLHDIARAPALTSREAQPEQIDFDEKACSLSSCGSAFLALSVEGRLHIWGSNFSKICSGGSSVLPRYPVRNELRAAVEWISPSCSSPNSSIIVKLK